MPRPTCLLDGQSLVIDDVVRTARHPAALISIAPEARRALLESRGRVDRAIESGHTIYGINTGFGKLANVRIPPDQLDQLQTNLLRSHAAGVGSPLAPSVVR